MHATLTGITLAALAAAAAAQPFAEAGSDDALSGAGYTGSRSADAERPPVRATVPPARTETPAPGDEASGDEAPAPADDRFHVSLDLTYTSQYFFRGIVQETDGLILQPSIEIGVDLYEADNWSLAGSVGMWNSFHDEKTGSSDPDDFVATWYEADFYAGLSLTIDRVTAAVVFCTYASPNDAFTHVDELSLTVTVDDSGWFGPVSFAPYATLAVELSGQADGGANRGTFLGIGIEPSHTYEQFPLGALTVSIPVEAGFSLDDYYENAGSDESFGYLTVGLAASLALPAPEGFGDWSLHAGVDYLLLGDATEAINADDDSEWIVHAGIGVEF